MLDFERLGGVITVADFDVRQLQRQDYDGLLALYQVFHRQDDPLPYPSELAVVWEQILTDPNIYYFVAQQQQRLISTCNLTVVPNLTRGARPWAVIENVATLTDARRIGAGAAVVKAALSQAKALGCYKVMLMTGAKDPGVHEFYKALGFADDVKQAYLWRA